MRRIIIGVFSALVLLVLFCVTCTFVRKPYETILLNRFGNLIGEKGQVRIAYHWYLKYPTDTVVPIDNRLHLYTGPLQQLATFGHEAISIRTFAAWRIVDPVKFFRTTAGGSDQRAEDFMDQKLRGLVQAKLSSHGLDELFNVDESKVHTSKIEEEVATEATHGSPDPTSQGGKTSGLEDQGLEIVEVGFSRIAFPPNNADAVYRRMVAELTRQAVDFDSRGKAEAAKIRSQGDQEAATIIADAQAKAQLTRGQGDREALRILASVQESPAAKEFFQYWKSLEFARSFMAKNNIMVLSSDSDLLKDLFRKPQNGQFAPSVAPASPGAVPSAAPANSVTPANSLLVPLPALSPSNVPGK